MCWYFSVLINTSTILGWTPYFSHCKRWGSKRYAWAEVDAVRYSWWWWIEIVASIITPTSKNLNFVVTLSPRSKCADKQKVAGVTTNYLLSRVVTLLSRAQSIDFQLVILKVWRRDGVTTKKHTLERSVFSLSCGPICRAHKYNKGASWRNKDVNWQPYCIFKRTKDICGRVEVSGTQG